MFVLTKVKIQALGYTCVSRIADVINNPNFSKMRASMQTASPPCHLLYLCLNVQTAYAYAYANTIRAYMLVRTPHTLASAFTQFNCF